MVELIRVIDIAIKIAPKREIRRVQDSPEYKVELSEKQIEKINSVTDDPLVTKEFKKFLVTGKTTIRLPVRPKDLERFRKELTPA